MTRRFLDSRIGLATMVAVLSLAPVAGQNTWNPARTPDGQPDIQGFWANQGRRLATYNIEAMEGASDTHALLSGVQSDPRSLIVDPADGKIPYQP